jgi:hypothetical protein
MCPLCIASGTLALASAGSAGGLGALAAKVFEATRKRAGQAAQKANAGSVAPAGVVPAKAT